MELEKCWAFAMHQDHSEFAKRRNNGLNGSPSKQRRQRFKPMWRVREHMAFLIRNLQFYIQVTSPEYMFISNSIMIALFVVPLTLPKKSHYIGKTFHGTHPKKAN